MPLYASAARRRPRVQARRRASLHRVQPRHQQRETLTQKPYGGRPKPPVNPAKPGLGAAPAQPTPQPQGQHASPDAAYYNDIDTSQRKEQSALGDLDSAQQATEHEYGFTDPTNPFSRVNSMKQAFLARRKAASVALSSEGKLYSGTHERAISRTRREEEAARAELRGAYEQAIRGIGAEKAGVKFASEEERNQAFEDWLARAPEADVELPADEEPPTENPDASAGLQPGGPKIGTLEPGHGAPATRADVLSAAPGEPAAIQKLAKRLASKQAHRRRVGKKQRAGAPGRQQIAPPAGEPRGNQQASSNTARIREVRQALMSHGKNWSQRPRLLAELERLRG